MEVYISEERIQKRVRQLAAQITQDFKGRNLHVVGVLNGAFMYCADLLRHLDLPVDISFVKVSSYGDKTKSSGDIALELDFKQDIKGKNVLLVEDIVDTGLTSFYLLKHFKEKGPLQLKITSLLFKPSWNKYKIPIDYLGFEIKDVFVVGYGMDYAGKFRNLPYIGIYDEN
ncbi:MAG: hypoxanthine phosphoribosyltransferase [Halobacteriovoraceae bacterium]|nr:hypoxanthine phosphoribosyltransferase [Halobacteriovoraceae bacterium]